MKRLFLVLASMASIASAIAQDVIVKRDGEEIQCRILEVSSNKVKFKQWKNQNGPTFVEKKADILMLKYENGQKEVISFSGPVGETKVEETVVAGTPVDSVALADTMPISNNYLEYARKEQSGLLKWGRSITEEQAHTVLGKDWTDFTRAHKSERVGRAMIFTGGALVFGGGLWTAQFIWASKDYNDKKAAYENHVAEANANYAEKVNDLYATYNAADVKRIEAQGILNNANTALSNANKEFDDAEKNFNIIKNRFTETTEEYQNAKKEFESAQTSLTNAQTSLTNAQNGLNDAEKEATAAYNAYKSFDSVDNRDNNFNTYFYNASFKSDMNDAKHYKKATLYPMIGCYASGTASI